MKKDFYWNLYFFYVLLLYVLILLLPFLFLPTSLTLSFFFVKQNRAPPSSLLLKPVLPLSSFLLRVYHVVGSVSTRLAVVRLRSCLCCTARSLVHVHSLSSFLKLLVSSRTTLLSQELFLVWHGILPVLLSVWEECWGYNSDTNNNNYEDKKRY